jgi:ketosteroid isomerase-like protein
MSEENLALVASIYSQPRDYVDLLDPPAFEAWVAEVRPLYAPDYEFHALGGGGRMVHRGLDGYLEFMNEWLAPWQSYTIVADEVRDLDPRRVAVLTRHRGTLKGGGEELRTLGVDLWTLRDGQFLRLEGFMDRQEGLAAAGLHR